MHIWTLKSTREVKVKPPIRRTFTWGGVDVSMLIDTGSPVGVVSRQLFEQHKNAWPSLRPSRTKLSCYLGKLPVFGELLLPVSYDNTTVECALVVLDCPGPSLCGRDLIFLLSDAGSPVLSLSAKPLTAQPSTTTQVTADVFAEFPDVFSSDLGLIKGPPAHLQLKEGATPKFYHQPLLGLLRPDRPTPPLAAARIQRWALYLGGFRYKLQYSPGKSGTSDDWTLAPDTNVYVRNFGKGDKWKTGTVKSADGARMVTVETPEGLVRRHVDQVHTRKDPLATQGHRESERSSISKTPQQTPGAGPKANAETHETSPPQRQSSPQPLDAPERNREPTVATELRRSTRERRPVQRLQYY
ncbi:uncharacterized protein LOC119445607 [Dermacentor silvarum]|uniref:uncharacterized protein LOC119445607 n=1 Tax=Dermacentor silvarum TaxID=543639 RepID=UPI002100A0E0|nr:uncharacterized protein LOC119445607 [Dermacentor silvarum]